MIGALALGFGGVEVGFVGFVQVRRGQICRVGDTVRDTVCTERRARGGLVDEDNWVANPHESRRTDRRVDAEASLVVLGGRAQDAGIAW
jgi:hypothetical protein